MRESGRICPLSHRSSLELPLNLRLTLFHQVASDYQSVHTRTKESAQCVSGSGNHWLPAEVKRGVHDHWHPRTPAKLFDHSPVEWIDALFHRLWPGAAINVRHRRNRPTLLRLHRTSQHHERRVGSSFQV